MGPLPEPKTNSIESKTAVETGGEVVPRDVAPDAQIDGTPVIANAAELAETPEPVAAAALALHLPKVTKLRQILCRGCNIGDIDVAVIARALPHCVALVTLNLQDNKIGPKGTVALAKVLPECKRLGLLYLASNKIGKEGALALAEYAPRCDTLRELW